jgi:hypothetical protein
LESLRQHASESDELFDKLRETQQEGWDIAAKAQQEVRDLERKAATLEKENEELKAMLKFGFNHPGEPLPNSDHPPRSYALDLYTMVEEIHAALPYLARESDLDDIPRRPLSLRKQEGGDS